MVEKITTLTLLFKWGWKHYPVTAPNNVQVRLFNSAR